MDYNAIPKSFSLRVENKYDTPKFIAFFAGTLNTMGLAKKEDGTMVFTCANPEPVQNYSQSKIDAILTDGVLPEMIGGELTIPNEEKGVDFLKGRTLNPQFRLEDLKKYIISNAYLINKITITVTSKTQFDNPITFKTSSPTENLGSITILPTVYNKPNMYQDTKIVIDNLDGTVLQDDTMIMWEINAGEIINITFEFLEQQMVAQPVA